MPRASPQAPFPATWCGSALNIIVCGKAWIASDNFSPTDPGDDTDKIWAYPRWREDFGSWLEVINAETSRPINVVWLGGDRHAVAFDDGRHNLWGHFPCLIGSAWCEHHLDQRGGETYLYSYPWDAGDVLENQFQYVRGTLIDNNEGQVTLNVELRYWNRDKKAMDNWPASPTVPLSLSWDYVT